jgi:hypothetical protein
MFGMIATKRLEAAAAMTVAARAVQLTLTVSMNEHPLTLMSVHMSMSVFV